MNIRDYLKKHDLSQDDFGKRVGASQGLVWQWLEGRQRITAERAIDIEAKTDRAITRQDLRPDLFGKPPGKSAGGNGGKRVNA